MLLLLNFENVLHEGIWSHMGSEIRIMTGCEWFIQRRPENVFKVILTAATVGCLNNSGVSLQAVSQSAKGKGKLPAEEKLDDLYLQEVESKHLNLILTYPSSDLDRDHT